MAKIQTVPELRKRLADALARMRVVALANDEQALHSIVLQLEALSSWTVDGAPPTDAEKARLSFGQLASRHLDDLDQALAQEIYEIATWVTHWR